MSSASASDYFSSSEGEAVIYSIVAVGIVLVLALIMGCVGYWCFRKGKKSRPPQLFARRPVWSLASKVQPQPMNFQPHDAPQAIGGGAVHIHHYDSSPRASPEPSKKKQVAAPLAEERTALPPTIHPMAAKQKPGLPAKPITHPEFLPAINSGNTLIRPMLPLSVEPELTAPFDNVLTDNLLRFATGSTRQVPRNTNLKSVLILNKQRRKNVMDDMEGEDHEEDWDEEEAELEERLASTFQAIGGDEIEVDAKGGRVFVDDNNQLFAFADDKSKKQFNHKEIL